MLLACQTFFPFLNTLYPNFKSFCHTFSLFTIFHIVLLYCALGLPFCFLAIRMQTRSLNRETGKHKLPKDYSSLSLNCLKWKGRIVNFKNFKLKIFSRNPFCREQEDYLTNMLLQIYFDIMYIVHYV